jgi:hypothetical protein
LESLRKQPGIKKRLSGSSNPMQTLFMGDLQQNLRDSDWLAITAKVKNRNGLYFQSTFEALRQGDFDYLVARERSSAGSPPQLSVPQQIARISLYRDLHDFYIQKDELFPERTSGLIFFENMMGIFFSGRDLADEVLAEIGPGIELVVAKQSYQELEQTPDVRLPGFAAVFKLNNPQNFGPIVEEAWQKAIGLVNFTRGQKAEPGLIIDRPQYQNMKYTVAYFSSASEDATRHIRYNLRPTLALPDDFMILSSSEELARDLMDSLRKGVAAAESAGYAFHSILELNGLNLLAALSSNRENLIQNNMVEEGNTREKAEDDIDGLLSLATLMKAAKLTTGYRENRTAANFDLEFNMAVVQ